jgi:uncharacterized protein YlxW (UPF0749 family)
VRTIIVNFIHFLFSSERGSFSFKNSRLSSLQQEVKRLSKLVQQRNMEREALKAEKDLQDQIVNLRKELGIEV